MDDLKLIRGIGPAIEKHLHAEGIRTFTQIEKLSAEVIAGLVPNVSANQISRQGWIRQARRLASEKAGAESRKKGVTASTSRQHYENFTLEFLLNEKNKIRRIRIVHVQSGDVDSWAKWSAGEISNFLARHTRARFPQAKTPIQKTLAVKPESDVNKSIPEETIKKEIEQRKYIAPIVFKPATNNLLKDVSHKTQLISVPKNATERIGLLKWIVSNANSKLPVLSLPHDQNFNVQLTLDMSKVSHSETSKFELTGMLFAKKMGSKIREMIGETKTVVPYSPIISLNIDNATLAQGLYRLEAYIKLNQSEDVSFPKSIDTSLQGGLFQVY